MLFLLGNVQAQVDSIYIGHGGGFSGAVQLAKIDAKQILKGKGGIVIHYTQCAKLSNKTKKSIFKQANQLWQDKLSFDHPGNTYTFLTFFSQGNEQKIVWGDLAFPLPSHLLKYYNYLQGIIQSQHYQSK